MNAIAAAKRAQAAAERAHADALEAEADALEHAEPRPAHAAPDALLGPRDVGVAPRTWRAAIARGELEAVRVGRRLLARREDVERWLAGRRVTPRPPARAGDDPRAAARRALQRGPAGRLRALAGGKP